MAQALLAGLILTTPVTRQKDNMATAYGAAAAAVVIWGATPAATQLAVDSIDPMMAGLLRTVLAAMITLPIAIYMGMPLPKGRDQWLLLIISAISLFIAFPLLFSVGIKQTSVAHASLINAGIPIFTGLFGAIAEKRMPSKTWGLGVAIAFVGVGALIGYRDADDGGVTLIGDLLCLASSAASGLGYVAGTRLAMSIGSRASAFWGLGFAGLAMAPLLYVYGDGAQWAVVTGVSMAAIIYMATANSIIAFIAWYWALAKGGIVRMAPVQFAMPVVSLTLAVTIFGDRLSVAIVASAIVIVSGIAIARKG